MSKQLHRVPPGVPKRRSKYGAIKVKDPKTGIIFDSKAEHRRFGELMLLARAGQITTPAVHPEYTLSVNGTKIGKYKADFFYVENGKDVVEDVKSSPTMTTASRLRMKVFRACYPNIELRIIRA